MTTQREAAAAYDATAEARGERTIAAVNLGVAMRESFGPEPRAAETSDAWRAVDRAVAGVLAPLGWEHVTDTVIYTPCLCVDDQHARVDRSYGRDTRWEARRDAARLACAHMVRTREVVITPAPEVIL